MKDYILNRLKEASTWKGLVFLATSIALPNASPDQVNAFITTGLGFAGLIGAFFPDKLK
jgi:hypothetical protein